MNLRTLLIGAALSALAPNVLAAPRLIDQVLQLDTIGMNWAYLEKLVGPPKRTILNDHELMIDSCNLIVRTDEKSQITAVTVEVSPACHVDLGPMLQLGSPLPLSRLSFGHFEQLMAPASFYSDCLQSCGNAYDPSVLLHHDGPRSMNFMEFMIQVRQVGASILDATDQWRAAMRSGEAGSWIMDGAFNCEPQKYHIAASSAFDSIRPTSFSFGHGLTQSLTAGCNAPRLRPEEATLQEFIDEYQEAPTTLEAQALFHQVRGNPAAFMDECQKAQSAMAMDLGGFSFNEAVEHAREMCSSQLQLYSDCLKHNQRKAVACITEAMGEGD